ncbi:MAG: DUF6362 family protein [Alphaproteobacteria bacterium]
MAEWTPSLVEARLAEAADVLKRLPDRGVQGYYNLWPRIIPEFSDLVGREPPRMKRPPPSPEAITRMEETLSWTAGLDPVDAKIVWLRAGGERWKAICWTVGLTRATAHQHWLYALCVIAWRLNGRRIPSKRSRSHVISMVRAARP